MRIFLSLDDGSGDNWLEVSERWTKKEVDAYNICTVEQVFSIWYPKKVTACSLMKGDGVYITDPAAVGEALDDLDYRLYGFLVRAIAKVISELFLFGSKNSQVSLRGTEMLTARNGNLVKSQSPTQ